VHQTKRDRRELPADGNNLSGVIEGGVHSWLSKPFWMWDAPKVSWVWLGSSL
jgi:hypothetical protein